MTDPSAATVIEVARRIADRQLSAEALVARITNASKPAKASSARGNISIASGRWRSPAPATPSRRGVRCTAFRSRSRI